MVYVRSRMPGAAVWNQASYMKGVAGRGLGATDTSALSYGPGAPSSGGPQNAALSVLSYGSPTDANYMGSSSPGGAATPAPTAK
jgi:hypothetical protein